MEYCMYQTRAIFIFLLCIVEVLGQSICSTPPTIQNGYVSSSIPLSATYSCNPGYQLSGSATAVCEIADIDLSYWESVPTCEAVPCGDPLTIPNASRTFTGTTYLDTATYTCNTGYQLSGAATVTCQASGSWSTIPSCSLSCGDPPNIPNGSRTFTGTTIGETATYTCDDGYHPVQPATVTCQATGSWDPVPFICLISCGDPPTIPNGSRTFTGTIFDNTATYTCDNGYHPVQPATVTCRATGSWDPVPLICLISCGNPPTIPNGSRTFTGTIFEDTATYTCNPGYHPVEPATVTCKANGSWSTAPTCLISCGNPPVIPNGSRTFTGTTRGDTATYTCDNELGSVIVTCQATGTWDTAPTCPPPLGTCGEPPIIPNGSRTFTGTTVGETATYRCNTGYQPSGAVRVTCQASESWDTMPICLAICGSPPLISNGSPGTPTSTVAGGTVTYTCNNGYQLSGSPTVTCQASGSWTARPSCSPVSCNSTLPSISNGSPGTPTSTTFGGTVIYMCNTGYQRLGQPTVTCLANGSWSTRPICSRISDQPGSCADPPAILNGSRTFTNTTTGDKATYTCNTGYQLLGAATVTCEANGTWATRPICDTVSCGSPPFISNGSPGTPTKTTIGGTATYACDTGTGYQLSGSAIVTCEASGSWSVRPSCNDTTDFTTIIVGAAMATVIVLLIIVVFVIVIAFKNYQSKIRDSMKKNSTGNHVTTITEETIMTNVPLNGIPRSMMSLPSVPAEYEEPDMTAESEYDEIWSSENGDNEHIFALGPCSAYK